MKTPEHELMKKGYLSAVTTVASGMGFSSDKQVVSHAAAKLSQ
jgi:hypothetical protein